MGLFRRRRSNQRQEGQHGAAGATVGTATRPARSLYRRLPRRLRFLINTALCLGGATTAAMAAMMVHYTLTFPNPVEIRQKERTAALRILARDGSLLGQRGGAQDFIPLDLLPPRVIDAVIATEDRRFLDHWGLDPIGLLRASFANLRAGHFAQGGSTLTQQLAKNLFLTPERTMVRKIEELVLAFWLEVRLSKQEILELYLNRVYFGGGAYGIEAASQRYFDKSARELSIAEAAVIAGLLKAPSRYSPTANPRAARSRGRSVLAKMRDAGVITRDQERIARAQVVRFTNSKQSAELTGAEYAVDLVLEKLPAEVREANSDLVIETTIDLGLQRRVNEIVRKEMILKGSVRSADQVAAVVLDTDGGIRALAGGRSYEKSQFNRAIKARRQPGSAFKPFVYLSALERGLTPDSIVYDLPLSLKGWTPHNEDGRYSGAVSLRHALTRSINTVAVRLVLDASPAKIISIAKRLGIEAELRDDPSLALGTSEVSLTELSGAYAAFANGGRRVEPHVIRRIRSSGGRVVYARSAPATDRVVSEKDVGAMNDMLNAALTKGTGKRAAIPRHPAAGKTGTSQDYRDAWFVGYTAQFVGGVWVGNDKGATMDKVLGGQLPADMWRQIMLAAHSGLEPMALPGTARQTVLPPRQSVGASGAVRTEPPAASRENNSEVLPWLVDKPPPARAHPEGSIDGDFLARMLGGESGPMASDTMTARQRPDPAPARQRGHGERIVVHPPAGMMSLGGALAQSRNLDQSGKPNSSCGWWTFVTGC